MQVVRNWCLRGDSKLNLENAVALAPSLKAA